jgi:hypothetical protein
MRPENLIRRAKPNDKIFCANRSWDHGTEVGLIKKIEDDFQRLAEMVIGGQVLQFDQSQTHIISAFYVLWMVRAEIRRQPEQDRSLNGMQSSRQWSKDEEEQLEKAGLAFFRGNIVPGRIANGMRVHVTIGRYLRQINPTAKWGIVEALDGEFVVPDWPIYALVPITPTLALANPAIKQTLNRDGVALVNG